LHPNIKAKKGKIAMKTKKRLGKSGFALILALLLAFSPAAAFAAEVEGNVPESKTAEEKTVVQETKATEPTAEAATEPDAETKPEAPSTEETKQMEAAEQTKKVAAEQPSKQDNQKQKRSQRI
jgi:outer membrane biosynthesis protein TonB